MIKLTKPIDTGMADSPYDRAAVRKLVVDTKDKQVSFVIGFGNADVSFCEAAPVCRFSIRKGVLSGDGRKWELPEGFYHSLVSGVGGAIIPVLEQRLVACGAIEGVHDE